MKVQNMAMNQFIIYLDNCTAFQSYDSLIAVKKNGRIFISGKWNYSKTTLKYFKQYINRTDLTKKEIGLLINNNDYYFSRSENELHEMIKCQKES